MLPVPTVLTFPAAGDTAPPLLPVRVSVTTAPLAAIVTEPDALVMEIPEPAVKVAATGRVVPLVPIKICPAVKAIDD
jgi:hypothetical protein